MCIEEKYYIYKLQTLFCFLYYIIRCIKVFPPFFNAKKRAFIIITNYYNKKLYILIIKYLPASFSMTFTHFIYLRQYGDIPFRISIFALPHHILKMWTIHAADRAASVWPSDNRMMLCDGVRCAAGRRENFQFELQTGCPSHRFATCTRELSYAIANHFSSVLLTILLV